jgi:hypothetical protein
MVRVDFLLLKELATESPKSVSLTVQSQDAFDTRLPYHDAATDWSYIRDRFRAATADLGTLLLGKGRGEEFKDVGRPVNGLYRKFKKAKV